jgi:hypothetical protein
MPHTTTTQLAKAYAWFCSASETIGTSRPRLSHSCAHGQSFPASDKKDEMYDHLSNFFTLG